MKIDFEKIDGKDKNKIINEMKKPLYVINEFMALTDSYILNFTPFNSWIIKYNDIKKVKFCIRFKIQPNFLGFIKVMRIFDGNKWKKFVIAQSSLPFFYYQDVEIINKIIKIIKNKNKDVFIKDSIIKKIKQVDSRSKYELY